MDQEQDVGEETFRIAVQSRIYHADLLQAARKVGGVKELAKLTGINIHTLSHWILLKSFPKLEIVRNGRVVPNRLLLKKWGRASKVLCKITGKTIDELFPGFVRLSGIFKAKKVIETIKEVSAGTMLNYEERLKLLPAPGDSLDAGDVKFLMEKAFKVLRPREKKVLELRYGLNGGKCHTLVETADNLRITKERVRQIEAKAIRRVQQEVEGNADIKQTVEDVLDVHQCHKCSHFSNVLSECKEPGCGKWICGACIQSHQYEHDREKEKQ